MKPSYRSSWQTARPADAERLELPLGRPVAVLTLHAQLAPVAWAFAQAAPDARVGFVQTGGGAPSDGLSRTVLALLERRLLAGRLTAGPSLGDDDEAITTAGALYRGVRALGWDAAICGPGSGIVESDAPLGHGAMAALDAAHAALALEAATLLVARISSGEERERHRGIAHHTLTVLDLLLEPVTVALPAGLRSPVGADLRARLGEAFGGPGGPRPSLTVDVERPARISRHDWRRAMVDLPAYAASGLPSETIGRTLAQDPLFFGAALAGGAVLAEVAAELHTAGEAA